MRSRSGGFGLFLLGIQLFQFFQHISQQNEFPVATVGVLAVNLLAFFSEYGERLEQTCISAWHVLYGKQWQRLLLASYFHAHDHHLYYNMASFMWKALTLERHFGSGYLFYMIAVFSVVTNVVYVAISFFMAKLTEDPSYMSTCAVGFSGVLFALKVVTTHIQPYGMASLMGFISVPVKMVVWLELVFISVLFPNVSFVGHLAGILVGVAYVSGPLKTLMDLPFSLGARCKMIGTTFLSLKTFTPYFLLFILLLYPPSNLGSLGYYGSAYLGTRRTRKVHVCCSTNW